MVAVELPTGKRPPAGHRHPRESRPRIIPLGQPTGTADFQLRTLQPSGGQLF